MFNSLRGHFLIAGRAMRDPNFARTVVLLLEHNPEGALGVVVNRTTDVKVSTALGGQVELPEAVDQLFLGGPVETTRLFILHNGAGIEDDSHEALPGLHVGGTQETLEEIIQAASQGSGEVKFRLLAGCAGWGAEQLEGELKRADWYSLPATAELVFDHNPHELWAVLLKQAQEENKLLPKLKGDPALN